MSLFAVTFYLFAILIVGSAALMVFSKNIMHSAFALMAALVGIAVFYVLLYAGFLAATQLLVYVGGILVLILFGIMLTTHGYLQKVKTRTVNMLPSALFAGLVALLLIFVFVTADWVLIPLEENEATLTGLGELLLTDFMLPFQLAGVLLLLAIIGAVLMASHKKGYGPESEQPGE